MQPLHKQSILTILQINYSVEKKPNIGNNIYKGVFDSVRKTLNTDSIVTSHRSIQSIKSVPRSRPAELKKGNILDKIMQKKPKEMTNMNNSFVDKDALVQSLRYGVRLDRVANSQKDDPNVTFQKQPNSTLGMRRMTRDEYVNISHDQMNKYKEERLKDYEKDNRSIRLDESITKDKEDTIISRNKNYDITNSEHSSASKHQVSMPDNGMNLSLVGSTPRFTENKNQGYSTRNNIFNYGMRSLHLKHNKIIKNTEKPVSLILGEVGGVYDVNNTASKINPLEDHNITSQSLVSIGRYPYSVKNSMKDVSKPFLPKLRNISQRNDKVVLKPQLDTSFENQSVNDRYLPQSYRRLNQYRDLNNTSIESIKTRRYKNFALINK